MKAVRYHSPGPVDVLRYEDAPAPVPGRGEVVIRVEACGVNRIDVWARSGRYKTALPHILGTDISGVVAEAGPGVASAKVGDRGIVHPVLSDGTCDYCRRGRPNLCVSRGFVGVATDGGYAELARVPASSFIPVAGVDMKKAAAMPVDFGTAWSGLSRAGVGPDDTVMVWGAAGGLGHAAVQISKLLGAKVIAVVGAEGKRPFVESMGADHVVDHSATDVVAEVKSLTGGLGATVAFDHVGGETWGKSVDSLARGGRLIALGLTSGASAELDVRRIYSDELTVMGTYGQTRGDLERVFSLAGEGKLDPAIHAVLPLESAAEAHRAIESREVRGKMILEP